MDGLNGASTRKVGNVVFVALPRNAWRPIIGGCRCPYCSADGSLKPAYWDVLIVNARASDHAWTGHAPEMHGNPPLRTPGEHGYQIGDNTQIAHCKRLKTRP